MRASADAWLIRQRMDLGARIREIRNGLGLSQTELARRSGVNQPTLQRIESGSTADPSTSILLAIAGALGVRIEDLTSDTRRLADIVLQFEDGTTMVVEIKSPKVAGEADMEQVQAYADVLRDAFPQVRAAVVRPFIAHGISTVPSATPPASAGATEELVQVPAARLSALEETLKKLNQRLADVERQRVQDPERQPGETPSKAPRQRGSRSA